MIERTCGYEIPDFEVIPVYPAGSSNQQLTSNPVSVVNADGLTVTGTVYKIAYNDGADVAAEITVYENKKVSPGVTGTYTVGLGHLGSQTLDVELSDWQFRKAIEIIFKS